jgi:hypothetical protein
MPAFKPFAFRDEIILTPAASAGCEALRINLHCASIEQKAKKVRCESGSRQGELA